MTSFAPRAIEDEVRRKAADHTALWETLTNIDSGSHLHAGVAEVNRLVADRLKSLGFEPEVVQVSGYAPHVVARRRRGDRPGHLAIIGHTDTVWQEPIVHEWPFSITDGIATGPGSGDMKGNVVMALAALEALDALGIEGPGEISFLLIGDEELGSPTGRAVVESELARGVNWALCLEAADGDGRVCTSRAGLAVHFVTIHGRSAHITAPDGISAVSEMARKIIEYEAVATGDGEVICGVGVAKGGVAKQVVPDRAELIIDLRARSAESMRTAADRLRDITGHAFIAGTRSEIAGGVTRPVFPRTPGTVALYARAREIARSLGISSYGEMHEDGGSDGSFAAAMGIPTLDGMGPICWDGCSRRERVDVESVWQRAAVFGALLATTTPEMLA